MKVFFLCNQGQNRSKTAAQLFSNKFQTKSAGLYSSPPVTPSELSWADTIIVMEDRHRKEIAKRYPNLYLQKRILSMEVPDIYQANQVELITILQKKMKSLLWPFIKFLNSTSLGTIYFRLHHRHFGYSSGHLILRTVVILKFYKRHSPFTCSTTVHIFHLGPVSFPYRNKKAALHN